MKKTEERIKDMATAIHDMGVAEGYGELMAAMGILMHYLHSPEVMAGPLSSRIEVFDAFTDMLREQIRRDEKVTLQ